MVLDALGKCLEQSLPAERLAVDADDLHSVGKASPVTDSAGHDLGDGSIGVERHPDGIQSGNSSGAPVLTTHLLGGCSGRILNLVATPAHHLERQLIERLGDPLQQE